MTLLFLLACAQTSDTKNGEDTDNTPQDDSALPETDSGDDTEQHKKTFEEILYVCGGMPSPVMFAFRKRRLTLSPADAQ